jgi:type IV secretory pathway VirB10-like protein
MHENENEEKLDPFDDSLDLEKTAGRFNKKNMKIVFALLGGLATVGLTIGLDSGEKRRVAKAEAAESGRLEADIDREVIITDDDYKPRVVAQAEPAHYESSETLTPAVGRTPPPDMAAMPVQTQDDGRASGLFFEGGFPSGHPVAGEQLAAVSAAPQIQVPNAYAQQNNQDSNQAFYRQGGYGGESYGYVAAAPQAPRAYGNEIKAGTVLPIVMVTGINSDIPGDIKAQVVQDVYDSLTGRNLLLPKGSILIGNYNSTLAFGQERLMVAWQRIIRPDGVSLELGGMVGVDPSGVAGMTGKVNMHYDKIFKAAGLASLFDVGLNAAKAALSSVDFLKNLEKFTQAASSDSSTTQTLVEQSQSVFNQYATKVINQQPTITVEPGARANVFVNKDMILPLYQGGF